MLYEIVGTCVNLTRGKLPTRWPTFQAVKRNAERFPEDFAFQLTPQEFTNLKSQSVTSSWRGRRTPPRVFTEHGVAMLSSVLRSKRAAAGHRLRLSRAA
ncbi:MAG: ORF6N domain-containing protein [Planctomycetes bacterium]|nr:ORF6N domain-containing protein [Planctomycetota bacterium]